MAIERRAYVSIYNVLITTKLSFIMYMYVVNWSNRSRLWNITSGMNSNYDWMSFWFILCLKPVPTMNQRVWVEILFRKIIWPVFMLFHYSTSHNIYVFYHLDRDASLSGIWFIYPRNGVIWIRLFYMLQ